MHASERIGYPRAARLMDLLEADESVFAFLRRVPSGHRSKDESDQQLREERESWGAD